ncbi:Asp-tRNA(Asn)/Glu-tRNA(Gln) amidotransferase subunit GatB [bacterium]|nr:Asp-tRNA(Asn)/Glu-tRNA(Gln) amidotransferase subunit GatB [bacterium]
MTLKTESILDHYPEYEVTIGIEVHAQLTTKTKIFCSCANTVGKTPNTDICSICSGHPGVLPVLNKKVVNFAILAGLATKSKISKISEFARKHYFYPDLPKGYQITQNEFPICTEGFIPIYLEDGTIKNVRLTRIHIEEDAGKNIHSSSDDVSFVDLNRAGTPLLEIVSHPDISSTYQAKTYLKALRSIVQYLNICSGNMEEGAFRADTNISVKKKKDKDLGTRCELKNINSFKFIGDAIEYEIQRQIELLKNGQNVVQETRLWDSKDKKTIPMRSKEEAADYRYFQDPDLPLIEVNDEWISRIEKTLPELPYEKQKRFCKEIKLSTYEASILVEDKELANYFERAYSFSKSKQIINWILRDLLGYLKEHKISLIECKVTPDLLAKIVTLVESGKINNRAAKEVFEIVAQTGQNPEEIVKEKGLEQIGSVDQLEEIVKTIVESNPDMVEKYKSGKDRLFGFFVGQAMKKTQGKGDPKIIQELLKKHLQ